MAPRGLRLAVALTLTAPVGFLPTVATADSENHEVVVTDVRAEEGDSSLVFNLLRAKPTGRPISVDYETADGEATAGADYEATAGTVTFPAHASIVTVAVRLLDDRIEEPDETFRLKLSPAGGGVNMERDKVTGTIVDDDASRADLRITVTNATETMLRADTLHTTFVVTNLGPDPAEAVVMRVTGQNHYRGYGIAGVSSAYPCAAADGGNPFIHECFFGVVPTGASRVAVFDYVADSTPSEIDPTGTVVSTTADPNPDNNTGTDSTRILIQPDLITTVSDGVDTVPLGRATTMVVEVRNQAWGYYMRDTAPSFKVLVEIPPQSRLDSYEAPEGSCARPTPDELVCSYGVLTQWESRQLLLGLTAVQPGPAVLRATAVLPDDTPDLRPENNTAEDLTTVLG